MVTDVGIIKLLNSLINSTTLQNSSLTIDGKSNKDILLTNVLSDLKTLLQ